jgi:hypothetical protein
VSACRLVVPGFVGIAGLHGRDDVHQPGTIATFRDHACNNILLANMRLADMFYGYSRLGGQQCPSLARAITQRLGKCRVVEASAENTDRVYCPGGDRRPAGRPDRGADDRGGRDIHDRRRWPASTPKSVSQFSRPCYYIRQRKPAL